MTSPTGANFTRLKNQLLPPLDQGVAALLDDLVATGLLDETLVLLLVSSVARPRSVARPAQWAATIGRRAFAACSRAPTCGVGR